MNLVRSLYLAIVVCFVGCDASPPAVQAATAPPASPAASATQTPATQSAATLATTQALATFAGGCFWCMEPPFDKLPGVISTTSGYTGGHSANPDYQQVTAGGTGHYESVQVVYDPSIVSYERLIESFWQNVDPLDAGGQFCDRGGSYRTAIFVHDEHQHEIAETSKVAVAERFGASIATKVITAGKFYPAEEYHQDYYQKNPLRYAYYRRGCRRDARLAQLWGPADH